MTRMARSSLFVFSFALVACQASYLESGRYACEPGEPDQCPGQWRCGLEGYCHQLGNTSVAWRCATNDDCEGQFVCGLPKSGEFRECHDPAAPQDWPCEVPTDCVGGWSCGIASGGGSRQCHDPAAPEAWPCELPSDCLGGWQCGLSSGGDSRQCHDPAAPREWPCEVPSDCVGGWQCGLSSAGDSRQCHDPAAPRAFRCEVESDCVAGWSCGLATSREHRECHDPANPRAFACADDTDCLAGWRCGAELTCVDPSADALGLTPPALIDGGTHLNSLTSKSPITLLSVSPFYAQGPGQGRANLAYLQDGHLRARSLDFVNQRSTDYDLGIDLPVAVIAHGARGTDENFNADELEKVTVAWSDGGISTFTFADGGLDHRYETPEFPADRLAHGTSTGILPPSVLAFPSRPVPPPGATWATYALVRGDTYAEYDLWTYLWEEVPPFHLVPNNKIHAMTSLRHSADLECVFAVDERGLWVSQRGFNGIDSYDFEQMSIDRFEQTACATAPLPRIKSVSSVDSRWLAVTAATTGGPMQVAMLDAIRTRTDRSTGSSHAFCTSRLGFPCDSNDRIPTDVIYGPCVACPTGSTFQSMATVVTSPSTAPELEVSCGQPNGASSIFRLSRNGATSDCTRSLVTGEGAFFLEGSPRVGLESPGVSAWAGSTGQIWFGTSAGQMASFTFDRAANGVVRRGPGRDALVAFTSKVIGTPKPGVGLISAPSTMLTAPVKNATSLAIAGAQVVDVTGTGAISEARPLAFANVTALNSPTTAVLTRVGPGTALIVIAGGTALYVGDLTGVISTPGLPVPLTQRLTTIEPVSSLAFPAVLPMGPPYAAGYAVTGSNVVRVVADTSTRWRTEPVPVPAQLIPRATWFDGAKGRVGFQDGSVFSLPSRVRISEPLPGDDAVDYAQACGQQLALAPTGLFRLQSSATEPVGTWQPVPLPAASQGLDFTEGRVHGVGNEVFVFSRLGEAARVTFEGCPE